MNVCWPSLSSQPGKDQHEKAKWVYPPVGPPLSQDGLQRNEMVIGHMNMCMVPGHYRSLYDFVINKDQGIDLRGRIVSWHRSEDGYRKISAALKVLMSTVASIVRKWKTFATTRTALLYSNNLPCMVE